jgi:SAM-dependent methyltransferase
VYDAIAPHFSATRYAPWPRVDAFLAALPPDALLADVGCGNGKYLAAAAATTTTENNKDGDDASLTRPWFGIGTDRCAALAHVAAAGSAVPAPAQRRCDVCVADARAQPLRSGVFDAALNIAVVHHLASRARRIDAWAETARLLRQGGRALLYVWALERPDPPPEPRHGNRGRKMLARRFEDRDMLVPWHLRSKKQGADSDQILGDTETVYMRFYHVYKEGELEDELSNVPGTRVVESFYDHQNWCAILERTS